MFCRINVHSGGVCGCVCKCVCVCVRKGVSRKIPDRVSQLIKTSHSPRTGEYLYISFAKQCRNAFMTNSKDYTVESRFFQPCGEKNIGVKYREFEKFEGGIELIYRGIVL